MRFVTLNPVAMSILGSTPWIHGFCRGLFIFAYPPDPNVKARDRQGRLLPGWMYICVDRRGGVSTWLVRIAHWLELRPATPITDAVGSAMLYSPPKWFRDTPWLVSHRYWVPRVPARTSWNFPVSWVWLKAAAYSIQDHFSRHGQGKPSPRVSAARATF